MRISNTKVVKTLTYLFICFLCCSCSYNNTSQREAYPGFVWKEFTGAGLSLKVQENSYIKFKSNSDTIFIERQEKENPFSQQPVIKVFKLKNNDINNLLTSLKPQKDFMIINSWDKIENCEFLKVKENSQSQIYLLKPKGIAKTEMDKRCPIEPIPYTCGGYGVGNSGARYFMRFKNLPDNAIFVEIGQDAPLFDETSIRPIAN